MEENHLLITTKDAIGHKKHNAKLLCGTREITKARLLVTQKETRRLHDKDWIGIVHLKIVGTWRKS